MERELVEEEGEEKRTGDGGLYIYMAGVSGTREKGRAARHPRSDLHPSPCNCET